MNVTYRPFALTVSDFEVLETATQLWEERNNIETSSMLLLIAFRVLVKRGVIPPYEAGVTILFADHKILLDKNGTFSSDPDGFCSVYGDLFMELI